MVLAACRIGRGKIFVAAHDCYLEWFARRNEATIEGRFFQNLVHWFTGDFRVDDNQVASIDQIDFEHDSNLSQYKIIKWRHDHEISGQNQSYILQYLEDGGGLFCASTPWGYLQLNPGKTLSHMPLYNFLKNYAGILFTSNCLDLPDFMEIEENLAKISHFDMALEKVTQNPDKLAKYSNTIQAGFDILHEEKILSDGKIARLQDLVLTQCESHCLNVVPTKKNPVCDQINKSAIKLLGKCLVYNEDSKAPGCKEFPGDFDHPPELLTNVEIILSSQFQEQLSTGYYLPAGIHCLIQAYGDLNKWSIRIGAHTDDLNNCDSYSRWPCVTMTRPLKADMCICSPYGGLIYFESPGDQAEAINVTLTNVVEAPFIDLTLPETIGDWSRRKQSPGLWAELAGKNIIFTAPSEFVRHIRAPKDVLDFWDRVVESHHELRGTCANDFRRERVVNDQQPSAGYMHSGYPIVTHLDCCEPGHDECIFDLDKLETKGNWGLFHGNL